MTVELTLLKATIDAWAINAKREKEAVMAPSGVIAQNTLFHEWSGQEIALKRVQDLLEKAGAK